MILTFIRHGETLGNLEKRYIGKTDEPLCESGIEKIKKNLREKKYPAADIVFSSPMKRCVQTCALIYPQKNAFIIKEFCEMNFGKFEGKNYEELKNNLEYQNWIKSGGEIPFPEGEAKKDFQERSMRGFDKMIKEIARSCEIFLTLENLQKENYFDNKKIFNLDKEILKKNLQISAVVHGGTIMAIMSALTGKNYYDFQIANGDFLRYEF